ncbi:unnamed protein product [Ectocarpus fasciculatus]
MSGRRGEADRGGKLRWKVDFEKNVVVSNFEVTDLRLRPGKSKKQPQQTDNSGIEQQSGWEKQPFCRDESGATAALATVYQALFLPQGSFRLFSVG